MLWTQRSRIFELTLEKMKDNLAASGYVGYIDVNSIANGTGIYPLEFTSRFGYTTISIHMEGITSKWASFSILLPREKTQNSTRRKAFRLAWSSRYRRFRSTTTGRSGNSLKTRQYSSKRRNLTGFTSAKSREKATTGASQEGQGIRLW